MVDLDGWARTHDSDGVSLVAPDGRAIAIAPKVFEVAPREGAEHLVTDEGEVAALIATGDRCTAWIGGEPCMRIETTGLSRAEVIELVRRLGTGLGARRRRMFNHEPPAGWRSERRVDRTRYTHPEWEAAIEVFDAWPVAGAANWLERYTTMAMDGELSDEGLDEDSSIDTDSGLAGRLLTVRGRDRDGRATVRRAAAFCDFCFYYQAAMTAGEREAEVSEVFSALCRSFEPLPTRTATESGLDHWAD